jgi:5-methylcytosine-specific restriction endonuclease McrA
MRNQLLIIYKAAARRRNYAWELTDAQFDALIQNACHYCGEPPSFRKDWKRFSDAFKCNGVDRMDNSLGYADANCVTACKDCNRMKGTMAYADFIAFLKKAGQFQMCGTEKAIVHAV